jgi:hypothetical protein
MSMPFKLACALWVNPDFSQVMAGRAEPPRVDHSKINFAALRDLLNVTFTYGPPVEILVPNDTIDQVTVHIRSGEMQAYGMPGPKKGESLRCNDFGKAMLKCATNAKNGIVNVRAAWEPLHAAPVKDREFAPPPTVIPFVAVATDFEDAQIWLSSCRPIFGLPVFDMMAAARGEAQGHEGSELPDSLRKGLKEIFGSPFEKMGLLDRMAMDKPPKEYGLDHLAD